MVQSNNELGRTPQSVQNVMSTASSFPNDSASAAFPASPALDLIKAMPKAAPQPQAQQQQPVYGNTNPEEPFEMTPDGSTRVEWATWRREEKFPPEVTGKRAAYLYALATFVQRELDRLGIRAYAEGGSMLGQARDGGIIRYDDDIDMQVHYADKQRFLAAAPHLTERVRAWGEAIGQKADLVWTYFGYMAVLIPSDPELQTLRKPGSLQYYLPCDVEVDLFLTDLVTDANGVERIVYADPTFRRRMQARGDGDIAAARLGSLPRVPFGPTSITMPEDGRGACMDVFGAKCFDQVVCKDGRNSTHRGSSLAVPMDEASLALYQKLIEATEDI
eukprot:CAMPEP_0174849422 /NCGR_PEP_ID=MMETSP1114-20130205/15753_1 /TAXON_ID=312471 /ORGANISM="Neobodo designis, Strain CCAP 1951/1" /LENGTH=331 /DNA_ID=CAMNT_0016083763 /DNA_START=187 /DNA_END=1182 /DNA_ORIENTATION=+